MRQPTCYSFYNVCALLLCGWTDSGVCLLLFFVGMFFLLNIFNDIKKTLVYVIVVSSASSMLQFYFFIM